MIVVDATVVSDFLLGEGAIQLAAKALVMEDPEWVSSPLWRFEFGNVMLKLHRHTGLHVSEPESRFAYAESMIAKTVDEIAWSEVWDLAVKDGLSFYDASYAWLARSRALMLRTRDKGILHNCPDVARPMPVT